MSPDAGPVDGGEVLVVPPTRRDGEVTLRLLREAGIRCETSDLASAAASVAAGEGSGPGAVLIADNALSHPHMVLLLTALARQPRWSDIPVVLMTPQREMPSPADGTLALLTNVTVLDRPVSVRSMVSAVQAALRARRRQFQIREQMALQETAEQALREADRRKDEFLATLAHELRNPLAPLRTALHVMAQVPGDPARVAQMRRIMERQVAQLVRLVDDLLDVSRIATGKVLLRRERVDLLTVVQAAIEASQPLVDAAGHALHFVPPPQPMWVLGDPSRLAQVVGNLINNAAKYTPPGGRIDVRCSTVDGMALLEVLDNGAGLPPEMVERVFELFTQVNRTLDRAQGGLGIGLSLVRHLVELHGGTVTARSPGLDRGSTFAVRLPLLQSESPVAAAAPGTAPRPRTVRVLIVDDNIDAADALALQLQLAGHHTMVVYGGSEALHAAADFEPEVVLCDLGMPEVDGHTVAARLRADPRHRHAVLVALTGWGAEEDRRRTREAGFDLHLVKPVDPEAIARVVAQR